MLAGDLRCRKTEGPRRGGGLRIDGPAVDRQRLTVQVQASILATCFAPLTQASRVVACVRRRAGRERARFFPTHPAKRVGFVFIRHSPEGAAGLTTNIRRIESTRREI